MIRPISTPILVTFAIQVVLLTQHVHGQADQTIAATATGPAKISSSNPKTIPVSRSTFRSESIEVNDKDFFVEIELENVTGQTEAYRCLVKLFERRSGGTNLRIDAGSTFGESIDAKLMVGTYDNPIAIKFSGQISLAVPLGSPSATVKIFATFNAKPLEDDADDPEYSLSGNFVKKCVRKYMNSNSTQPQIPDDKGGFPGPTKLSAVDPCSEDPDDMTMTLIP